MLLNNQNGALIKSDEFILNSTGSQCKKDPALVNTSILAKTPTPQYHEEDSLLTHKHYSPIYTRSESKFFSNEQN